MTDLYTCEEKKTPSPHRPPAVLGSVTPQVLLIQAAWGQGKRSEVTERGREAEGRNNLRDHRHSPRSFGPLHA